MASTEIETALSRTDVVVNEYLAVRELSGKNGDTYSKRLLTLGASLLLSLPTAPVEPKYPPFATSPPTAISGPCASPRSTADILRELESRMSDESRALYRSIVAICEGFGEPIDVNALVREVREGA